MTFLDLYRARFIFVNISVNSRINILYRLKILSYQFWPIYRVEAKLGQEGVCHALQAEGHTTRMGWRTIGQADVQAASEKVLVVVIRAYRQGRIVERQPGADFILELESALEGDLL